MSNGSRRLRLTVLNGPREGENFDLDRDETVIGRSSDSDVQLAAAEGVSRRHCAVLCRDDGVIFVVDLGSRNGTWVSGERIDGRRRLELGDIITIGAIRIALIGADEETTVLSDPPSVFDQLSITHTIDPAALVKLTPRADREAERLRRRLQVLYDVSDGLVGKLSIDEVLPAIAAALLEELGAERSIVLRRGDDGAISPVASRCRDPANESKPLSRTIVDRAASERIALLVEDAQLDAELRNASSVQLASFRSAMCVPLLHHDALHAVLWLDADLARSFGADDLELVSGVANQVAMALANAELVEDLKRTQSMLIRNEKLRTVGELAASTAHDIGNVLTPITGFAIKARQSQDIAPELKQAFARAVAKLDALTRQLRSLSSPEGLLDRKRVDLNPVVQASVSLYETEARHNQVRIRAVLAAELPPVWADPERLDQVFVNLIKNAIEAMPDGGELVVTTARESDAVVVRFRDDGPGIPADLQSRIFDAFFTTKGEEGTGLGLASSKRIVEEEHGGELLVESEVGVGTTFRVVLAAG